MQMAMPSSQALGSELELLTVDTQVIAASTAGLLERGPTVSFSLQSAEDTGFYI